MILKNLTSLDKIAYGILLIVFAFGVYFSQTDLKYFEQVYAVEDGLAEYATAIFLACIGILQLSRLFKFFKTKSITWKLGVFFMGLIFLFGAGEEISWGQRIFGIESSEYFIENNAQGETNLHNLVVDGKKINKVIFSQLLTLILVLYLIITPVLYRKFDWVKNLATLFAVPMVKWHHSIAFILGTLLVTLMSSHKKWEIYELGFAVIFLLIFLNPLNKKEIY